MLKTELNELLGDGWCEEIYVSPHLELWQLILKSAGGGRHCFSMPMLMTSSWGFIARHTCGASLCCSSSLTGPFCSGTSWLWLWWGGGGGGGAHGRLGLMLRNTVLYLRIFHSGSHIVVGWFCFEGHDQQNHWISETGFFLETIFCRTGGSTRTASNTRKALWWSGNIHLKCFWNSLKQPSM